MAFVGPLTSACIGLICLALRGKGGAASSPATAMVSWLGYINLALAGFNMIPGYPLDGGPIPCALIWWKIGDMKRLHDWLRRPAWRSPSRSRLWHFAVLRRCGHWRPVDRVYRLFLLQAAGDSYRQMSFNEPLDPGAIGSRPNEPVITAAPP